MPGGSAHGVNGNVAEMVPHGCLPHGTNDEKLLFSNALTVETCHHDAPILERVVETLNV